jgi:hypothetical protein
MVVDTGRGGPVFDFSESNHGTALVMGMRAGVESELKRDGRQIQIVSDRGKLKR